MSSSLVKLPITESPDVVTLLDKVPLTPLEKDSPKLVCCVTGATGMVGSRRRRLHALDTPYMLPSEVSTRKGWILESDARRR